MAIYICTGCEYIYDEDKGDSYEGYPAGTKFNDLPDDFVCPYCSVCSKEDFYLQE